MPNGRSVESKTKYDDAIRNEERQIESVRDADDAGDADEREIVSIGCNNSLPNTYFLIDFDKFRSKLKLKAFRCEARARATLWLEKLLEKIIHTLADENTHTVGSHD